MSLQYSQMIDLGSGAHSFSLKGSDGSTYTLESFEGSDVLVLVFMCNHCPYVKACIDRLLVLQDIFRDKSVQFVGINANDNSDYPEDNFASMKDQSEDWGMTFPYLFDEGQKISKAYGAVCTPDIFVYDADRELVYRGRIDDQWQDADLVTEEDLRYALEDVIEGREVQAEQKPSMGCSIKWVSET